LPPQTTAVNPSFNIRSGGSGTTGARLFIEAGPMGISIAVLNAENCFSDLVVYPLPAELTREQQAEELVSILKQEKMLSGSYKKTDIIWAFPESILVPNEFMNSETGSAMLNLVYGDLDAGPVRSDFMFKQNIHDLYRVPAELAAFVSAQFPLAYQTHQYSLLPELAGQEGNMLCVIFYNNRFTAMLQKGGKLQLIQHFCYREPDDAAYHLLNICRSFEADADSLELRLYGMVDSSSGLYSALYKYFLNIHLEPLPENAVYAEAIKEQPPHFFSHLFRLALCV